MLGKAQVRLASKAGFGQGRQSLGLLTCSLKCTLISRSPSTVSVSLGYWAAELGQDGSCASDKDSRDKSDAAPKTVRRFLGRERAGGKDPTVLF